MDRPIYWFEIQAREKNLLKISLKPHLFFDRIYNSNNKSFHYDNKILFLSSTSLVLYYDNSSKISAATNWDEIVHHKVTLCTCKCWNSSTRRQYLVSSFTLLCSSDYFHPRNIPIIYILSYIANRMSTQLVDCSHALCITEPHCVRTIVGTPVLEEDIWYHLSLIHPNSTWQ